MNWGMTMADTDQTKGIGPSETGPDGLDAFFQAARQRPEPASPSLMARVLNDALAVQDGLVQQAPPAAPTRPSGLLDRVSGWLSGAFSGPFAGMGGWPAVVGLSAAALTGVWIGITPALGVGDAMTSAMAGALGVETVADPDSDLYLVDYATGFEFAFSEGEAG